MTPRQQRRLLDSLEVRFARAWQKEIARAMRAAARDYSNSDNYLLAMAKHKQNATNLIKQTYQIAGNEFAQPIYEKAGNRGMITKDFENFARIMQQFINTVGADKVTRITETTNSQIRQVINKGITEGLSVAEISSNLRKIAPSIAGVRSTVIARTETHSASQWAQIEAIRDTGIRLNKEWVAASDERTRIDHMDANGQIVGPDDAFEVGGERLEYPGDPSGSPENVINCRCVLNFVETEPTADSDDAVNDDDLGKFSSGAGADVDKLWDGDKDLTELSNLLGEKPSEIKISDKERSYYSQRSNNIVSRNKSGTFTHEYGHFIDASLNKTLGDGGLGFYSTFKGLDQALFNDAKALGLTGNVARRNAAITKFKLDYFNPSAQTVGGRTFMKLVPKSPNVAFLSDIYDASTKGVFFQSGLPGHGKRYYKKSVVGTFDMVATETFANMSVLRNKPEWNDIKKAFPQAAALFDEIIKEAKDKLRRKP